MLIWYAIIDLNLRHSGKPTNPNARIANTYEKFTTKKFSTRKNVYQKKKKHGKFFTICFHPKLLLNMLLLISYPNLMLSYLITPYPNGNKLHIYLIHLMEAFNSWDYTIFFDGKLSIFHGRLWACEIFWRVNIFWMFFVVPITARRGFLTNMIYHYYIQ